MSKKIPQVAGKAEENALAHVDVSQGQESLARIRETLMNPRERFFHDLGGLDASSEGMMLQKLLWAQRFHQLKESRSYKEAGFTWDEVCGLVGLSPDTADRLVADFREFGEVYFTLKQIAPRLTREAFRAIGPVTAEDGCIVIGGNKLVLSKANYPAIQAELAIQQEKLAKQAETLSEQKSALETARQERDDARKGAKNLQERMTQLVKEHRERFAAQTDAMRMLLEADEAIRYAANRITAAKQEPELTDDERAMATEFGFAAVKVLERAFAIYPSDLNHHGMQPDGKMIADEVADRELATKVREMKGSGK